MKRPLSVTVIACLYIAVGVLGFAGHFKELLAFSRDAILVEITELLALIAGLFLLRAHDWARWLAIAWIAFHVALSAFNALRELVIHCVILAVVVWCLCRTDAARYFRAPRGESV